MKFPHIPGSFKGAMYSIALFLSIVACVDDPFLTEDKALHLDAEASANTLQATSLIECSDCDYIVPADQSTVDGAELNIKPGSVIGLSANVEYKKIIFRNIVGTAEQPIIIRNCGGIARIDGTGLGQSIKTTDSKHFRITGGDVDGIYGIVITGGQMSLNLGSLTTNVEVDHLEIMNSGFAGIMAKTEPTCKEETWRENFLMEEVYLHHNYIHDTGGEGIYAGHSWFNGFQTDCGVKYPHEIHNIAIHDNIVKNAGWEAIQLGCATEGASIYNNYVENYGTVNKRSQNNGIQLSAGTGGLCYNNVIKNGPGNGLAVFGLGDNIIFNNIIDRAGEAGIFCDERESPGNGFVFLNNTILNPGTDGIRIYSELLPHNVIINNIIANPGNYSEYYYPRKPEDAFIYKLTKDMNIEISNNYLTTNIDALGIINLGESNYKMDKTAPVIDAGMDVSAFHEILTDFYGNARLSGTAMDIGAIETSADDASRENTPPVANAGPNQILTSPATATVLRGSATDSDGQIASYFWSQYAGAPTVISNPTSAMATVSGLKEGAYYFRLTVTDNDGAVHYDNMLVRVEAGTVTVPNEAPSVFAGENQTIILPVNTTTLPGTASDNGRIVQYSWTQYGGSPAILTNANTATATVSGLKAGGYYFRLTVTDDSGESSSDAMLVKVVE